MKMAPAGDGTQGVRSGEEERLRRHRGRKNMASLAGMRVLVRSSLKAKFLVSKKERFLIAVGKAGGCGREPPKALCRAPNWSQAKGRRCMLGGWITGESKAQGA